jgi:hypothetical protein
MNCFMRALTPGFCLMLAVRSADPLFAQVVPQPKMNVLVLEGEGAVNNVNKREPRDLVVQVRDGNRTPLPNAAVTFTLPAQGPSGEFFNKARILTTTADDQGRAVAKGFRPNLLPGKVEVHVNASHQGETARATITQFNMIVQSDKGGSGKWIALLAIAGAAAAGGAVALTRTNPTSSSSGAPAGAPVITISPGGGTVGPPQ